MKLLRKLTRRRLLAGAASGLAALGLYTWRLEPHWLQLVRRTMPIRNLSPELVGALLMHVSDLHIGPQVDDAYITSVFDSIRELSPEIVVYTGDFVSHNSDLKEHAPRVLSKLACGSLGTFGILGNHDYGSSWQDTDSAQRVASLAQQAGVVILRNELASVSGLKIVGMDELWAGRFDLGAVLPQLRADDASLVLVHNPDTVDEIGWGEYSGWILAGHTHGGQCKPPFLPPPFLPVRNRRYTSGVFALTGSRRMYVSRGVGHLMRVRFNAQPELTLFELTAQSSNA